MDLHLCSNELELNSQIYVKAYLEESRKRPNPSGLTQLPGFNVTSTSSSVAFTTSISVLSTHSQLASTISSSDGFVSTLKRSKRTTNLSELQYEQSSYDYSYSEERLLPVQVDLAALVAHPPALFCTIASPDGLGWDSTGLCLSSDESVSEVDNLQDTESTPSFSSPPSRLLSDKVKEKDKEKTHSIVDDVYRPLKIRRQTEALNSWSQLQRLLDTDQLLSSPPAPLSLPSFTNSCNTSPHTCAHRSHSRVVTTANKQAPLPPTANATAATSQTQPLYSSSSKSQPRKLASSFASSLTKKNASLTVTGGGAAPRILSSAASATVACASAALSSASTASVGYNYNFAASGFLAGNKASNVSNFNANFAPNCNNNNTTSPADDTAIIIHH